MTATSDQLSAAKRSLVAAWLQRTAAPAAKAIAARPVNAAIPLSPTQERLWSIEQFAPSTAAHVETQGSLLDARLQRTATPVAKLMLARSIGSAVPLSPTQEPLWFSTAADAESQLSAAVPLSPTQERLWFSTAADTESQLSVRMEAR